MVDSNRDGSILCRHTLASHEAVATDGRAGRFALKLFHPPPSGNIRRFYAIEGWLIAAERQKAEARKSRSPAEVVACGYCAEGAYAVTRWQEHSVESLVETLGRNGDLLRSLAEHLLEGLEAWEAEFGQPHGNLKPSNIFLREAGPLRTARFDFNDPSFLPGSQPDTLRRRDLASIGSMLAEIVRRRKAAGWPIEPGPEWSALGRAGKPWLDYCNFLLNPRPDVGELTFENARRRLNRVPRDAKPVRTTLLVSSACVVLCAGGVTAFARFGDPSGMPLILRQFAETTGNPRAFRTEVTSDWALLCRAWSFWLGDVERNLERLSNTKALWGNPDPLQAALIEFRTAAPTLRPKALVPEAANEPRLGVLADAPPEAVRRQLLRGTVSENVTTAWRQIDTLATALETWPRWTELRQLHDWLETRGLTRAAAALRVRLPPATTADRPKTDPALLLRLLNEFSLDDSGMLLLSSRWNEISRLTRDMEQSGDRVQAAMPRLFFAKLADASSVGELADALAGPLAELQQRRARFLDPMVVRERFLKESALQSAAEEVKAEDISKWEQELISFSRLTTAEDPRLAGEFDARVTRMIAASHDLEKDPPATEGGAAAPFGRDEFNREFEGQNAELKTLRNRVVLHRDLATTTQEVAQLEEAFRLLEQRLDATLALLRPDLWLRRAATPAGTLSVLQRRWADWQRSALGGVTREALERDRARFRELRQQERSLRDWIEQCEGPAGFGSLVLPDLSALTPEVSAALRQLEIVRREQAADAVASLAWTGLLPTRPWGADEAVRAPLEAHRKWLGEMPAFGAELERLGGLLSSGAGWEDGIIQQMDQLAKHGGIEDIAGRAGEWLLEAKHLAELATSNDSAALTRAAQGGGLSRQLTAFRRLGALSVWPAGAEELDVDGALVTRLRETIASDVKTAERRDALLAELTKGTRLRWNRAARNSVRSDVALAEVFQRLERYGISETDLEGDVAFNLNLWRLKRADWSRSELGELRNRRSQFTGTIRALPTARAQPEVTAFLQKMEEVELVENPKARPGVSPALAGWREDPSADGQTTTAIWSSGGRTVRLEFLLVQPDDETLPFYLARYDISVGEFIDLVGTRSEARAVLDALPPWTRSDSLDKPWNKPMSWRPRSDALGVVLNPTWIYLPDAQVKALLDNSELRAGTPILERAVMEKPTLRSPLQQVPPDAARLFAERLVGARLPRPQEWRAVMRMAGAMANGNFRGTKFKELWQFLESYQVGGQSVRWRPNEGVFLPLVATPGGAARRLFVDDGQTRPENGDGRLWLGPVDEGPAVNGFVNLVGNVWVYLYDDVAKQYYVAGGSALSPPEIGFSEPLKVEGSGLLGARRVTDGFTDVGIRPAFDAPAGVRERYKLLLLVRQQPYLTF